MWFGAEKQIGVFTRATGGALARRSAPEDGLLVAVLRDLRQTKRIGLYESILPVCCVCGLIRDDSETGLSQDPWGILEDYVQRRASARFSHTYCPRCLAESREKLGLR